MKDLEKVYSFLKIEEKILNLWQEKEVFKVEKLPKNYKKDYLVFLPPPNITGTLHMGHALNATMQDILVRYKRLKKFRALWIPGIDHAGIATNRVVEKELLKEGKTRFDIGKEEFLKRVWQWREKYGNIILDQLKRLGASFDSSKTVFTMDENYSLAVKTAFLHYFKKGMIFKKERVVNWCPQCQTSLSDLEIEYTQEKENLYYIRYPLSKEVGFITVATTRPETMLGDTAVAVNPKDKRYSQLIGKKAILPLAQREIPIIEDFAIDINFGTGAVKVTPGHDPLDYEISLRHRLPILKVINEKEKICAPAPLKYQGLEVSRARKVILDDLQEKMLLEKTEEILHNVPRCERCKSRIEFLPSLQWFLSIEGLKEKAIKAVLQGKVKFVPKRFERVYLDWLKEAKDWCISRQIWWGHKIPLENEEDVLDTWFSSALWPLGTLGWPKTKKNLKKLPSDVLVTGRDIINLWVARMVFSSLELVKKIPFKYVLINPTVLTKEGKRMSKSLGIGIDPLVLIKKYGADAVRFGLIWQTKKRQDIRFSEEHLIMAQKFANKIWNAARFVLLKIQEEEEKEKIPLSQKEKSKKLKSKIIKDFKKHLSLVEKSLETFDFGKSAEFIYHFFWHRFCDIYLEKYKKLPKTKENKEFLLELFKKIIIFLHPFLPFITEALYQELPFSKKKESIAIEDWPKF